MKTITLELPDEVADAYMKLPDNEKVEILFKSIKEKSISRLETLFDRSAQQIRTSGMSEAEIDELIDSIS
ncbi:MAG: hypothetical protein ACKVOU_05840 [Cytophagales bacterium]